MIQMLMPNQSPMTRGLVVTLVVFLLTVLIALLLPNFSAIVTSLRQDLRSFASSIASSAKGFVSFNLERFWSRLSNEPRTPVAHQLVALRESVEDLGQKERDRFSALDDSIGAKLAILRAFANPNDSSARLNLKTVEQAMRRGSLGSVVSIMLVAVAIGAVNAFLLNIFFRETIGAYRLLPYPLPDVQASLVIALLFFVVEIACGWFIYTRANREREPAHEGNSSSFTEAVMTGIPWFMLFALLFVEILAYAVLSVRIDMPSRLGLANDGALTGPVKYFLAVFGACITATLAFLGHQGATAISNRRTARANQAILRAYQRLDSVGEEAKQLSELLPKLRDEAATIQFSLGGAYEKAVMALTRDEDVASVIKSAVNATLTQISPEGHPTGAAVRTRSQILADVLIGVAIQITLFALGSLFFYQLGQYLGASGKTSVTRWMISLASLTPVVMTSFMLRNSGPSGKSSAALSVFPVAKSRRWFAAVLLSSIVVSVVLFVALAVNSHVLGASTTLNGVFGFFEALAIVALGCFLDFALLSSVQLMRLLGLLLVHASALFLAGLALGSSFVFLGIVYIFRVLALPGDLVLRLFGRSPTLAATQRSAT